MAVTLGKDVEISGISNARSITVNNSANEVEITKFGDTSRKFVKAMIEQTLEVECIDDPGVDAGDLFTLTFADTGAGVNSKKFIVTSVAESDPLDGIKTFTVSASRANQNAT
jgi:hypothetical protein